jgi:predicted RNA-binding Zn ribbon-like protein
MAALLTDEVATTRVRLKGVRSELRGWVLPAEPVPVRLMNTIWADSAGIHDDLESPLDVDAWLAAVGLADRPANTTVEEHRRARSLRDALRRLAAFRTHDDRPAAQSPIKELDEAIGVVNAMAAGLPPMRLGFSGADLVRAEDGGAPLTGRALASVAIEAIRLLTGPAANQLRACRAPGCVLYFVKSHPRREWCSEACGNRARVARHYRRVRASRQ